MSSLSSLRRCTDCREEKPLRGFHCDQTKPGGRSYRCKACAHTRRIAWAASGGESAAAARYRARHPERVARSKLKNRLKAHGWTLEQYDAQLAQQGGQCVTCNSALEGGRKQHLDHCHGTGVVRAILCDTCNRALGYAQDDPKILRAMADYIEHHRARSAIG